MKKIKCEDIVMNTSYLISVYFKSIRKHRKKACRRKDNKHKQKAARKKLAGIFGKFF